MPSNCRSLLAETNSKTIGLCSNCRETIFRRSPLTLSWKKSSCSILMSWILMCGAHIFLLIIALTDFVIVSTNCQIVRYLLDWLHLQLRLLLIFLPSFPFLSWICRLTLIKMNSLKNFLFLYLSRIYTFFVSSFQFHLFFIIVLSSYFH